MRIAERQEPSQVNAGETMLQETIVFPPFSLDLRAGLLRRGSQPIPMRPKTFAVLRHLVQRPGSLVTKDDLLDAVWADTAVTENTLTQSIGELRRALKDDSTPPRFIETVHHRGFRFVAPISGDMRGSGSHSSASPSAANPFAVGRAAELHRLDEALRKARQGQRQLVLMTGEPGIGKTTLIQTFLATLATSQVLVASGQAVEQVGAREPYLAVLDALGRLARIADPQHVVGLLRRVAPAWLAQMPWLLKPADAAALRRSLIDVQPERMLRELAVFLEEFSSTATLILVLEDLHWSDPSTVELLLMLAQRSEPTRLLVIGTYRPAEASVGEHPILRAKQTLMLRRQCIEIALQYLTRADIQAYLDRRFPQAAFPSALAGLIHEHTDGNPLFMAAVIDQLIARGWLVATDPGWALAVPLETLRLEVPDDLREMIRFQFHGMGPADSSLLEAASVNGVTLTAGAITQAIDGEQRAVERGCEHLVQTHRFLRIADDEAMPGERAARQYAFIHALHQQVIYDEIPAGRRRRLHLRLAEALERAHDGAAQNVFRLAAHFERGGDRVRAITYLVAAAAAAQERFAPCEAITCLEAALKLTEHLPEAGQRRQREIDLRIPLISALNLVYGYASDEVRENCERTRALCEQNGSLPELYEVLYALWYSQLTRAEKGTARETADRLLEVAERLGSAEHRLRAASTRGRTALWEGNYQESRDTLQAVIAAWERSPDTSNSANIYGVDPLMAAYGYRGLALWFLGYPDSARLSDREALSIAHGAGVPFTSAAAHVHAALVELLCGDAAETLRLADQGLAFTTEHAFSFWGSIATAFKGWAQMRLGKHAQGCAEIRSGIALLDSDRGKLTKPLMLALLAEGGLRLGNLREGLASVSEGLHLTQTTLDRFYEPELWRLKGELLLARSKVKMKTARRASRNLQATEAEQCFQYALKIARERGARSLELRAAMSLARLEQIERKRGEAQDLLAKVYGWFTEGHNTMDLQDARTLQGR